MESKNMRIEFSSALSEIVERNKSFDMGKLRIAYTGKNRNNTFISKESFERAIPTMYNCPVVANYIREDNEIGSHDSEFIKDTNGHTKMVNITQPVGMVPESAQWNWETVEDNGVIHQYLCTDVVLWKRQEAYEKIKENGITKHSMEIEVINGEMLDDYYDIKDFCFTAFCLLGTAEPCFESAALFTFEQQETFKAQYTEMLKEFKLACADVDKNYKKEGNEVLKLDELLEKYSVSIDDLTFDVEGLSDEELEAKFAEVFDDGDDTEGDEEAGGEGDEDPTDAHGDGDDEEDPAPATDPEDDEEDDEDADGEDEIDEDNEEDGIKKGSFALNSQRYNALREAVMSEQIDTEWGSYPRRWMVDFDEELCEVYFIDENDGNLYGCNYEIDGDEVSVSFDNQTRKKFTIVDYVEGSFEQNFSISTIVNQFETQYSELAINNEEFTRLRDFEADVLKKRREDAENKLFNRFSSKLKDNDGFNVLRDNSSKYDLEELEKELYALVGMADFEASNDVVTAAPKSAPGIVFEDARSNDPMRAFMSNLLNKDNE